jgi:hypothetical protein
MADCKDLNWEESVAPDLKAGCPLLIPLRLPTFEAAQSRKTHKDNH